MYLFASSKDILNIALAVSSIAVAFFICWVLFYLAMSFKKLFIIVEDLAKTITLVKEKVENFSSYFLLIGEGIKKILEFLKRSEKKEGAGKKKTIATNAGVDADLS